jgi:hypothetical protein
LTLGKQLMPVHDKPMIYYPLSVLMRASIREILIITTHQDQSSFQHVLGDGSKWALGLATWRGLPRWSCAGFIIVEEIIGNDNVVLVLGCNLFYGHSMKFLCHADLIVLEDWGQISLDINARCDLLELFDDRHGQLATLVTSQLLVEHWREVIGDPTHRRCDPQSVGAQRLSAHPQGRIHAQAKGKQLTTITSPGLRCMPCVASLRLP